MFGGWRGPTISVRTLTTYEISDELNRHQIQVLEHRYGGRLRAHAAASRIQRAFREFRLLRQWRRLVAPFRIAEPSIQASKSKKRVHCFPDVAFPLRCSNEASSNKSLVDPYIESRLSMTRKNIDHYAKYCSIVSSTKPTLGCLSPCLGQKRNVGIAKHQASHIWLPRSSIGLQNSGQSNSLPRLDKYGYNLPIGNTACPTVVNSKMRKRQYRIALNFFNKKPPRGIQYLIDWGFVENDPLAVAKLLIGRRGLSKQMIGEYLGEMNDFQSSVLRHFIDQINFNGLEIDLALRHALSFFRLPGEAQKIERIMQVFSARYQKCNLEKTSLFCNSDTVFILAFAVVMLNTDLHSPNIKSAKKMKMKDFIHNLRGIDAGRDIDRNLLARIYCRIRDNAFRTGCDHVSQILKLDQSIIGKDKPKLVEPHRRLVCYCRLSQIMNQAKHQAPNSHQREVFLFNDLLLIGKATSKRKNCCQYSLRTWMSLLGLRIRLFESSIHRYGFTIALPDGRELHFNSKNDEDRQNFVADVKESTAECNEMETIRIESEMEKHIFFNRDGQWKSGLSERETGNAINTANVEIKMPGLCFTRRLSYNSLDSGVVDESNESFMHPALSPLTSILTNNHVEAAL